MHLDLQIVPFKKLSELPESSSKQQMLQPIPPYMHTKEKALPKLT